MANSLIEDVLNEQPINNGKNPNKQPKTGKKKSKKLIVIIFILIVIILCALGALYYLQNNKEVISNKAKFFEVLANNNVEQVSDVDLYQEVAEKLIGEDSNITTEVELDLSDINSALDNMNFLIESQNDIDNGIIYSNVIWNYSDIELLNLDILVTGQAIGFKSPQIVNPYVGFSYEYISEMLNETVTEEIGELSEYSSEYGYYETDEESENNYEIISESVYNGEEDDTSNTEIFDITGILNQINDIQFNEMSEESKEIYKNIIDEKIDESAFSSQEVTLELDSGNVDCTEYSLTITDEELVNVMKEILIAFETDTETLDSISEILNIFEIDSSYITETADELITEMENADISEGENVVIKVYDNNGQTVKIAFEYAETKAEIEYGYGDSSNYIKITLVDEETEVQDGISYKITNVKTDLKSELNTEVSVIESSVITSTVKINTSIVESGSTYKVSVGIYYQSEDMNLSADISSDITFEEVELDEPVYGEEFIILDELDEETMNAYAEQIGEQLTNVVSDNITQILLGTVSSNSGTTVIQQMDASTTNNEEDDGDDTTQDETNDEEEEAILVALQEKIDTLKQEKEENSEELTLSDLEDLEIEGYEVQIEIGDDLAIITIDDYIFNINSEFEITN